MPVLAKDDKGVGAGVCHGSIDLRNNVEEKRPIERRPGACWWHVHGRLFQFFSHVRIETSWISLYWLHVTSIDRTHFPATLIAGEGG